MIKLSIIIPVYNAEKYLEQCLTSIYNEYNDAIEVILIDDGSTDGSSRIYNNFRDKNLKIYKNTNHGVSYSRNYALTKAKGKYIMFIDADDYLKEKWFDKIHSYLDSQKDLIIFSKNTPIEMNRVTLLQYIIGNNSNHVCIAGPYSKLYRKQFLIDNNITFNEKIINGEDMLFNTKCCLTASEYEICNTSIYMYRINYGSATKSFNKKIVESDIEFHKQLSISLSDSSFPKHIQSTYTEFCKENAVFTIINRISYISKYLDAKKQFFVFTKEPYKTIITSNYNKKYKNKIVFYFLKRKIYFPLYIFEKLKNKTIKFLRKKEYYVEI